jgi:competence protein ComEA
MKMMKGQILMLFLAAAAAAQQLPDGPGRKELETKCKQCHELARSISLRQDHDGWSTTMAKMVAFGMKGDEKEFNLIVDYLTKNYPAEDIPKVNVNKATAIELESGLSLRRSQAAAVLAYRAKNGDFKSIDDLKKVPLIDAEKIEARKDRIAF